MRFQSSNYAEAAEYVESPYLSPVEMHHVATLRDQKGALNLQDLKMSDQKRTHTRTEGTDALPSDYVSVSVSNNL